MAVTGITAKEPMAKMLGDNCDRGGIEDAG
jgi:hypothetical protein